MISLRDIQKSFERHIVIKNLSLELTRGQCLCVCGPSGLGKTTLLEIAAGIIKPDAGTVVLGTNRVACVFQDDILVPWLNAEGNIQLTLHELNASDAIRTAREWLDYFDLPYDQFPTQMSGGMRRRLSLARAFACSPDLLLLDEPFAFLDEQWQIRVADTIEKFRAASVSVLMISHQKNLLNLISGESVDIDRSPLAGIWLTA